MNRQFFPYNGLDFITRRYYTLEDFYTAFQSEGGDPAECFAPSVNGFKVSYLGQFFYGAYDLWIDKDLLDSIEVSTVVNEYIFPRYWESYITYNDEIDVDFTLDSYSNEDAKKVFEPFVRKLIHWIRQTASKYRKELEVYRGIEGNLMAQVKTTTQTKANDTPQGSAGLDYADDPFISNIATTEQLSDVGTPIERLKQVRNNIRNTYSAWADEFAKLVMYA